MLTVARIINKFRRILSKHQKIRVLELGFLMVIGGFLEMLSVSLILPFMEEVMNPERLLSINAVKQLCDVVGIKDHRSFLIFIALIMAMIYVLKNLFLVFQMAIQNRFVSFNMLTTEQKLLQSYLLRPYEDFLSIKSGEILRVIGTDTVDAFNVLSLLLQLSSELIVSGILIATIFVIAPEMTFGIALILGILLIIIQTLIRPALRMSGEKNREVYANMNQWLLQSIQGIKEIKISETERFFEKNFWNNGRVYVKTSYICATLSVIPRFAIEAISMGSFFVIVAILLKNGTEVGTIIPMLSSVAIAAIRLLPSVNRISQSLANMTFYEPTLDKLIENINEAEAYDFSHLDSYDNDGNNMPEHIGFKDEIILKDIVYKYPSNNKQVLVNANLVIKKGESIGIVGASGAGKTTAVDVMLGLLNPQQGEVVVDGKNIRNFYSEWLKMLGYIPQNIFMLDGSIRRNVAFGLSDEKIDDDKVWKALKESALDCFVRELPDGLDTEIGERGVRLSGGQRQRIGIARALYNNPDILFFDEATSALDNETEATIMESIQRLKGEKTMIIIAHRLSTIDNCDKVYQVNNGKFTLAR